ncbi:MAG TPA: hemerythrin domain-containing protein [Telluria sp.]
MDDMQGKRRGFLALAASGPALIVLGAGTPQAQARDDKEKEDPEKEVGANEDLMREHGVLRRALLVYRAAATRLRSDPKGVPADALARTAKLFRTFGEDYHERKLEEEFIFPAVRRTRGPAAAYPDVLKTQHDRGRQLTDYVLQTTGHGAIASANVLPLARALDAFELMYEHHTAREDTIVFPAWKDAMSGHAYHEMSERFEQIEHQMFGHDGFEDAVKQIAAIEAQMGLGDIAQFTIGAPPAVK